MFLCCSSLQNLTRVLQLPGVNSTGWFVSACLCGQVGGGVVRSKANQNNRSQSATMGKLFGPMVIIFLVGGEERSASAGPMRRLSFLGVAAIAAVSCCCLPICTATANLRSRNLLWTRNVQPLTSPATLGSSPVSAFVDTTTADVRACPAVKFVTTSRGFTPPVCRCNNDFVYAELRARCRNILFR